MSRSLRYTDAISALTLAARDLERAAVTVEPEDESCEIARRGVQRAQECIDAARSNVLHAVSTLASLPVQLAD